MRFRGGGSLKASLARVFSLLKSEQKNSEQVIKKRCHAELDSASYHLGVLQDLQGVGLKAQPTVDSHMLSLREGQSPTKQSIDLTGLPRSRWSLAMTKNSITNLSPYRPIALPPKKVAFTMAEILLSLTIIGVVAAITLPSLTGNINERMWNTQRKALYSRISQAILLMPQIDRYGDFDNIEDTAAETFLSAGLSKVLKINNICDSEHLSDCGFPNTVITTTNSKLTDFLTNYNTITKYNDNFTAIPSYKVAAFETPTGESILVYYNPKCKPGVYDSIAANWTPMQPKLCANFVYDLNGKRGPNAAGRDIGYISIMYPSNTQVVAPIVLLKNYPAQTNATAAKKCKSVEADARLATLEEMASIYYNKLILGISTGNYLTSTKLPFENQYGPVWSFRFHGGYIHNDSRSGEIRCVKSP